MQCGNLSQEIARIRHSFGAFTIHSVDVNTEVQDS